MENEIINILKRYGFNNYPDTELCASEIVDFIKLGDNIYGEKYKSRRRWDNTYQHLQ